MIQKVTVVGGGSWATALVKLFAECGFREAWLVHNRALSDAIQQQGHNPRYLCFAPLKMEQIDVTVDIKEALKDSGLVIFAVPSTYLETTLNKIDKDLLADKPIAVSIKGFIPGTGCTPSRFISQYINSTEASVIVIGGPCHAEEIAHQRSTFVTIGGHDNELVQYLCRRLKNDYIKAIPNGDPAGIEYAFIVKNIIGIASGIARGLQYGDNFIAVLVSNAMSETSDLIYSVNPVQRNLFHSAYFGDLLVTAYSNHSRNATLGKLVGRGISINKAIQAMEMTAEGFLASRELAAIHTQSKIKMPVINTVYRILHQHANPYHEFKLLEEQLS
jgi:glycerol-3-phosphate dehydrogenase (NAD(P)+)